MKLSNKSVRQLEDTLWKLCRELTFKKYGNTCYTCGQRNLEKQNLQCGHYYPKGALGASMKYDLRILRPQCFQCNINHGGMTGMFREKMKLEIGKKAEQELFNQCSASKGKPVKSSDHYLKLILELQKMI